MRATEFLRAIEPDIYAKGGDYTPESLNPEEAAVLKAYSTRIEIIPFVPDHSTSALAKKMAKP